jgi:hypothetical protein
MTPRRQMARDNYAILQTPADYLPPVYQRAQSPTRCIIKIDAKQLPALLFRVMKPLPKSKRNTKSQKPVPKPKVILPRGWCQGCGMGVGRVSGKRHAYGVAMREASKTRLTAHERIHLVYASDVCCPTSGSIWISMAITKAVRLTGQ